MQVFRLNGQTSQDFVHGIKTWDHLTKLAVWQGLGIIKGQRSVAAIWTGAIISHLKWIANSILYGRLRYKR